MWPFKRKLSAAAEVLHIARDIVGELNELLDKLKAAEEEADDDE